MSVNKMRNDDIVICAHLACKCPVGDGETYCSEACRLGKSTEPDCFCKHNTCDSSEDEA